MSRTRKSGQKVTAAEVQECMDILAGLIVRTGDTYVPLYMRLESELEALDDRKAAVERIKQRAASLKQDNAGSGL